ncbi:DUF5454 family protein [Mycoplasmoides genitalium]|uniref:DUF5454 family protein n=1 Tax=Mycoplasmoides genitalium TaxID=2097 RepID=UPI00027B3E27|nr:DUF5454 family protein [Mycoplasmoides genitalium]AFQ03040.1 hypothetical protein CM9_01230 [Mycoplasmoides genitalium M2321]
MGKTKNKSDWQIFLEDYRFYFETDFDWVTYLNNCLNSYPDFDIIKFIKKYGPECEKSSLSWQSKAKSDVYSELTNKIKKQQFSEQLIYQLVQLDALRTNYLIGSLFSDNKTQRKLLKRSWKNAKKEGYTKQEWLMILVGLPFEKGAYHKQLYDHSRQEILDLTEVIKKLYLKTETNNDKLEFAATTSKTTAQLTKTMPLNSSDLDKDLMEFSGEKWGDN